MTIIIFICVLMLPIVWLILRTKTRVPTAEELAAARTQLTQWVNAHNEWNALDRGEFMPARHMKQWVQRHQHLQPIPTWILTHLPVSGQTAYEKAVRLLNHPERRRTTRNEHFVRQRMEERSKWFDTLQRHPLTTAQRKAIVTDEDHTLVVAAAGTGKTTTLEAKAAYMVDQGLCKPDEILVMAFNRKVADEVEQRLGSYPNLDGVTANTFHALGSKIIGSCRGSIPALSKLAQSTRDRLLLFQKVLRDKLKNDAYRSQIEQWFIEHLAERSWVEQHDEGTTFTAIDGQYVASHSEVKVANWLILNGIEFSHEEPYPHRHDSINHRDYLPDFYLPNLDVWIEVWAVDKKGRTAPHINAERYRESMQWKRDFHQRHNTILVEIDQDEIWSGDIAQVLKTKLTPHGAKPAPIGTTKLQELMENNLTIENFCRLVDSFLQLQRSGNWTPQLIKKRAQTDRERAFLPLVSPFIVAYQNALKQKDQIDFHDMLLKATDLVKAGNYKPTWRCILVDETQDFSGARLNFLKALRDHGPDTRLVLVGDDWQSIYRFTGADVTYFTEAEKHLGTTARVDLDKTFRLAGDVHQLSSSFVTENPIQLRKDVASASDTERPGVAVHLHNDAGGGTDWRNHRHKSADAALTQALNEIKAESCLGDSVLILGRYLHVIDPLKDRIEELTGDSGLNIRMLTVHKSKGLEADHVIVLDVSEGKYGFPSGVVDDPVLQLVQATPDKHPCAEERRLFYVALTRSKNRVHLVAPCTRQSPFVTELLKEEQYEPYVEMVGKISHVYLCPECKGKTVLRRDGMHGIFWSCARFPKCKGKLKACPSCDDEFAVLEPQFAQDTIRAWSCSECCDELAACPTCRMGVVLPKTGRYGTFYGCSEWRRQNAGCNYTHR